MPSFAPQAIASRPRRSARGASWALAAAGIGLSPGLSAATFVVNSELDPGAATCTAAQCTLRAALLAANATPGADLVAFGIPGAGPHHIALATQLPDLVTPVTVDGYTQPGSQPNSRLADEGANDARLRIHIDGAALSSAVGFNVFDAAVTLRGLALTGFASSYVAFNVPAGSNRVMTVEGCWLGLAPDGSPGAPVALDAVRSFGLLQLGGTGAAERNVVVGATRALVAAQAARATLEGNLIGVLADGTTLPPVAARPQYGVQVLAGAASAAPAAFQDHRIGGGAGARNVFGGARSFAIDMFCLNQPETCFDGAVVRGNSIGVDAAGTAALPNGGGPGTAAISIVMPWAGQRAWVGGAGPGEGNTIAGNAGDGVYLDTRNDARVTVLANTIRDNDGLPVRFAQSAGAAPLPNDPDDPDTGTNRLQNWPQLLSVARVAGATVVDYRVDTAPANASYPLRVEFFLEGGHGAAALVGADTVALADAQQPRSTTLPFALGPFEALVATATDADGRTSQVSPPFPDLQFQDGFE